MEKRQLINAATGPSRTSVLSSSCSAFLLPSNGIITLNSSTTITLNSDAIYQPLCTESSDVIVSQPVLTTDDHFRDPFYASILPGCYALAATTVIAYLLVILLLITPETFLHNGVLILGRRGFINGPSSSDSGIGIGGRPWLQKVAVLTVAISLTIASANTFKIAEAQYVIGYLDAQALQKTLEDGVELKIIRVVSDTFLWLAQAQTLIRLFPRHREKIIIKWTAFALITLDELFSTLNAFAYKGSSRPRSFVDAVPALAYLFQLALSLLYAASVIYYSMTKKKFAFHHPHMKNICLLALLSLLSVLVPVVFFVTDISKPDLAVWGDYVRWVGAAAASVVVWEWVERIEALERNDKKDDVLGREIFDGDEMIDINPSTGSTQDDGSATASKRISNNSGNNHGRNESSFAKRWPYIWGIFNRLRTRSRLDIESGTAPSQPKCQDRHASLWPTRPLPVANSVSRTWLLSAKSTINSTSENPASKATQIDNIPETDLLQPVSKEVPTKPNSSEVINYKISNAAKGTMAQDANSMNPLYSCDSLDETNHNIFKEQKFVKEISNPKNENNELIRDHSTSLKWELRTRIEDIASSQLRRFRIQEPRCSISARMLPKTVIPAPPRRINYTVALNENEEPDRNVTPSKIDLFLCSPTTNSLTHGSSISDQSDQNKHCNSKNS